MNFTIVDCAQRSPEWYVARLGRVTSSRASDMLATTQKGWGAARRHLLTKLALERLTGKPQESDFQSQAMKDGIEREGDALARYEAVTGQIVERTGFLSHVSLMAGCSLDGHVGDFEGIVEAKSPLAATHLEYITTGRVPIDYLRQVQHQLWMTGARWCDWVSFHPDFPEPLQLKVVRILRHDEAMVEYESKLTEFLREVEQAVADLQARCAAVA